MNRCAPSINRVDRSSSAHVNAAVFGGGTNGTAGTVMLGGSVSPADGTVGPHSATELLFAAPNAGDYTIDLGDHTLTLPGGWDTLRYDGGNPTISNSGTGSLTAASQLYISGANGAHLTISAPITGNIGISKVGVDPLTLSNTNNSFTGHLYFQNGGLVSVSSIADSGVNCAAGAGDKLMFYHGGYLEYTGSGDSSDRIVELGGNGPTILYANGSGALAMTGTNGIKAIIRRSRIFMCFSSAAPASVFL